MSLAEQAVFEVKRVVVGQDRAIERLFACLVAGGDCLVTSPVGLPSAPLVEAFATAVGDTSVRRLEAHDISSHRGSGAQPASGSRDGDPSMAVAPIQGQVPGEVTSSPPLATRDLFLMEVVLAYPNRAEEVELVQRMDSEPREATRVLWPDSLGKLRSTARAAFVDRGVIEYAVDLAQATRDPAAYGMADLPGLIAQGVGPRATAALVASARALAVLRDRAYAVPQDVFDAAPEVLRHRIVLSHQATAQGLGVEQILVRILSTVAAPRIAPSQQAPEGLAPPTAPEGAAEI